MEKITNIIDEGLNINKEENKIPMEQIGFFNNGEDFKIFLNKNEEDDNVLYLEYKDIKTGDIKKIKFLDKYGASRFDKLFIDGEDTEVLLKKAEEYFNIIKNAKWTKGFSIEKGKKNGADGFRKAGSLTLPFYDSKYNIEITGWNNVEQVHLAYYDNENKVEDEDWLDPTKPKTTKTLKSNIFLVELNTGREGAREGAGSVTVVVTLDLE